MYSQFDYSRPQTLDELFDMLNGRRADTVIYAGGTDVIVQMRAHKLHAGHIVDVKGIESFNAIEEGEDVISIGCAVDMARICESPLVQKYAPALAEGCNSVGSTPIRHKATLAGNIQNASPAGDGLMAALGLGGAVRLLSRNGARSVSLSEFVLGPRRTALRPDEVISAVEIPKHAGDKQRFFKVGRRNALAISVVNGVTAFSLDAAGVIERAGIALGAVAPTPIRLAALEMELIGKRPSKELAQAAAEIVQSTIHPISDIRAGAAYRAYIAGIEIKRRIIELMEQREECE